MTTPTPRTDAVREEARGLSGLAKAIRFADLADALERDLAAAQERIRELETALLGVKEYREKNPLGGPAKVFDAMADAIRAGDDLNAVCSDYGWCPVERAQAAEARAEASERDAQRYRWLRVQPHADIAACWYMPVIPQDYPVDTPEQRDAAIDAAHQKEGA